MIENSSNDFNSQDNVGAESQDCLPPPEIDLAPFLAELQECGLTAEQATEFLATLVAMLWYFADLGFRVDISELLLSWADSDALDSEGTSDMETPSKAESEIVAQ